MTGPPSRPYWRTDSPPADTAHVVARDMVIHWDNSEVAVKAGTLVHAAPGSPLWLAYHGDDGALRPVHGRQARP